MVRDLSQEINLLGKIMEDAMLKALLSMGDEAIGLSWFCVQEEANPEHGLERFNI